MNKKGGLFLSIVILVIAVSVGFVLGLNWGSPDSDTGSETLNEENSELKEQISQLQELLEKQEVTDTTPINQESCEAQGGRWWDNPHAGQSEEPYCEMKTSDFGAECTDSIQCEGHCLAPEGSEYEDTAVGTCSEWKILSCFQSVEDGIVQLEICA